MSQRWIGKCIVQKTSVGKAVHTFRIIYVDMAEGLVVCVPFPKTKNGKQNNYVAAPRFISAIDLAKDLENSEKFSLVDFKAPEHWLWADAQMEAELTNSSPLMRHRRNLSKWKAIRDNSFELIRPFVEKRTIQEILTDRNLQSWPNLRAQDLGLKSSTKIRRALHAYLLGMADKRALMPGYANCGGPGNQKFSTTDTGRPSIAARIENQKKSRPCLTPDTRSKLMLGWKRHKRQGVSDQVALAKTRNDYFVKAITPSKHGVRIELKPEAFDISPQMFRYWGLKDPQALRSIDIRRGLSPARDEIQRRLNKARDRYETLNGVAYIDSTSTDQTLISSIHPLKRLKSPWRTEVLGSAIDYIFGIYVGFEAASATTALLAILNAASDKVALCARFGHTIEPRDWYSCTFNTFETDNGEGKGKLAMYTLEQMSMTASYGKAYDAINKSPNESGHHQRQKRNDHLMPGTTMGKQKVRGEKDRAQIAGLRFDDYMHLLLKEILHHNNKDYIDPPRQEMYPGLKERTRRGVVEWLMEHHYMSSSPVDIDILRVTCLPRFEASMHGDGIHVFVPGSGGKQLIKKLVYRNEFLLTHGLLHKSRQKVHKLEVHLNPIDLSHVWANIGGLQRFDLVSGDHDLAGVTLIDWLAITEDDKLSAFLANKIETQHLSEKLANIDHRYKEGRKVRQEAIKQHGKPTKTEMRRDIRLMTDMEKAVLTGVPLKEDPLKLALPDQTHRMTGIFESPPQTITNSNVDHWLDIAAQLYEEQSRGTNV